jgi:hypothetical protein
LDEFGRSVASASSRTCCSLLKPDLTFYSPLVILLVTATG